MSERAERGVMSALPPRELWLYNPDIEGLMSTALDERGLVDLDTLVAEVKATVDKDFEWTSQLNDAQRVAMSLSRTASLAVRLTRMNRIPEKRLATRLDQ